MVPEQFKDMPEGDLVDKLRAQMDGLSRKRINHVLQVCKHAPSCGWIFKGGALTKKIRETINCRSKNNIYFRSTV